MKHPSIFEKSEYFSSQMAAKGLSPDSWGRAGVFRDSIKHDFRSPSYTTKWSDIPEAE